MLSREQLRAHGGGAAAAARGSRQRLRCSYREKQPSQSVPLCTHSQYTFSRLQPSGHACCFDIRETWPASPVRGAPLACRGQRSLRRACAATPPLMAGSCCRDRGVRAGRAAWFLLQARPWLPLGGRDRIAGGYSYLYITFRYRASLAHPIRRELFLWKHLAPTSVGLEFELNRALAPKPLSLGDLLGSSHCTMSATCRYRAHGPGGLAGQNRGFAGQGRAGQLSMRRRGSVAGRRGHIKVAQKAGCAGGTCKGGFGV